MNDTQQAANGRQSRWLDSLAKAETFTAEHGRIARRGKNVPRAEKLAGEFLSGQHPAPNEAPMFSIHCHASNGVVNVVSIESDTPVRFTERGTRREGVVWTVEPGDFERAIEMVNRHGGYDLWSIEQAA